MHGSSLCRMRWFVETYLSQKAEKQSVLDVGSYDVAGGSYRQLFEEAGFAYTGLDMAPGPNVDIAPERPYDWREVASDSFDVVISGQAFEHIEFFWLTALEMARVIKPGGLLCLLAPRGFARHRYPVDCYRFDQDGLLAIARWCRLEPLHVSTDMAPPGAGYEWHIENCEDSMLVAAKPKDWQGGLNPAEYVMQEADLESLQSDFVECEKILLPAITVAEHEKLKRELEGLRRRLEENRQLYESQLEKKREELAEMVRWVQSLENSHSWRFTRPLRSLGKMARKFLGNNR